MLREQELPSMPGQCHYSLDLLPEVLELVKEPTY